jgi:hypothetical protein
MPPASLSVPVPLVLVWVWRKKRVGWGGEDSSLTAFIKKEKIKKKEKGRDIRDRDIGILGVKIM